MVETYSNSTTHTCFDFESNENLEQPFCSRKYRETCRAALMHKLILFILVLHELFKNGQPINMKDSLADARAFSRPNPQAMENVLGTRLQF